MAPSVLPGHYLYLDEDGPLEVLAGPARCQDTYRDWISLYCWAPFHAAVTATPEGSRCRWDHIGSIYSELSNCTEVLAEVLACPWPSSALDAFFLQIHAEYFSGCAGAGEATPGRLPPGLAAALAAGLGCLVPLAVALTLSRAGKAVPKPPGSSPVPLRAERSASRLRAGAGNSPAGAGGGSGPTAPVRGKELLPVVPIEILVPVVSRQPSAGWHRARRQAPAGSPAGCCCCCGRSWGAGCAPRAPRRRASARTPGRARPRPPSTGRRSSWRRCTSTSRRSAGSSSWSSWGT
ncbi:receptor activity-modifying protein 2 isoform X3 [Apteryx mantelli]|uniref:Receptor activity-modifying protein 2 isoform X3 n=1 Tax=Apteryx mantelli TaxID=2696672 RepID=A0ABM4FSP1_9AVES